MAIRIRKVDGHIVALCAAETKPGPGDLYLDDTVHHALDKKFHADYVKMGFIKNNTVGEEDEDDGKDWMEPSVLIEPKPKKKKPQDTALYASLRR